MLSKIWHYLFILIVTCGLSIGFKCSAKRNQSSRFDSLLFVQQWPGTYCMSLMESGNECQAPPQNGIWTIHGIWPSLFNTNAKDQPTCCDSSIYLDLYELQPIHEQLKWYWPSIRRTNPDEEFWEREWLKHGTCSVSINELNSCVKYFYKALDWIKEYDMTKILAKSNIHPNNEKSYDFSAISIAVTNVVNKRPSIKCYIDSNTSSQYLNEIRLCFDRDLQLIDCNGNDDTNCMNGPVNYRVNHSLDGPSGWFTFFAYCGLAIFIILIIIFAINSNQRHRWLQRLFSNNRFQNF